MSGPEKIGGHRPTVAPVLNKPGLQKATLDSSAVAESAFSHIEFNRVATSTSASGSLLGQGSALNDGASSLSGTSLQGTFGLETMGVNQVGEGGMLENATVLRLSPQDIHAGNTETAARAETLADKQLQTTVETLARFTQVANQVASQTTKELIDSVGIALKKQASAETGGPGGTAQALNGEGGKAFGDLSQLAAQAAQQNGIDLAHMPIEDAVMLVFMLISNDAKKDVSEQLTEMDNTRKKKAAMREAEALLRDEMTRIKGQANEKWSALPTPKADFQQWLGTQALVMPTVQTDDTTGHATLTHAGSLGGSESSTASASGQLQTQSGDSYGGSLSTFDGFQATIDQIKDGRDSLSELSETQQLKMQTYMDRMTKADSANSNLMKKLAETLSTIISNMK